MKKNRKRKTLRAIATLVSAALICAASLAGNSLLPLTPVPSSLQNMLCIAAACILGGAQGAGATGLFILAGGLGLPVFALGKSGLDHLAGPTGGYILGYFVAAAVSGLIAGSPFAFERKFSAKNWLRLLFAAAVGYAIVYVPGLLWLRHCILEDRESAFYALLEGKGLCGQWKAVLGMGLLPFLYSDIVKLFATVPVCAIVRPVAARLLYGSEAEEAAEAEELMEALKKRKTLFESIKRAGKQKKH